MPEHKLLIRGGEVVTPAGNVAADVLIEDGKLARIGQIEPTQAEGAQVIDAEGKLVLPGLIDVHVQGAGGSDLLQGTPEAVERVCRSLASFGTTAFLATSVVEVAHREQPHIDSILEVMSQGSSGARILGIHLEGPFINPEKKGMIQTRFICEADPDYLACTQDVCAGSLRMMTIAPELPGGLDLIGQLVHDGTIAALGHTNATYEEAVRGIVAGLSHVTHLANAMRSIHHRDPGALGAALMSDALTVQIIADGIHLHPAFLRWVVGMKPADHLAVITDGISAVGLPAGRYSYGGLEFTIDHGAARYGDGTLIGTALTQFQLVGRLMEFTGLPLHEAVNIASLYPARMLGLQNAKGSLEEGKDADVVICDRDLGVEAVLVEGRRVPIEVG